MVNDSVKLKLTVVFVDQWDFAPSSTVTFCKDLCLSGLQSLFIRGPHVDGIGVMIFTSISYCFRGLDWTLIVLSSLLVAL